MALRICIILDNTLAHDRRAYTEIKALTEKGYEVDVVCMDALTADAAGLPIRIFPIISTLIGSIKQYQYPKQLAFRILKEKYDVVHCHNWEMLRIGVQMKKMQPHLILIYESRELFHSWPINFMSTHSSFMRLKIKLVRNLEVLMEKRDIRYVDFLLTVNESLAEILGSYFKLQNKTFFTRNIPFYKKLEPVSDNKLRTHFGIPSSTKLLVFIGSKVYPQTLHLEQVITEICNQPNIALVFICRDDAGKRDIENFAKQCNASNVYFHPLLLQQEIIPYLQMADVGLVPTWNKKDLSYWLALDNKLFEYMMAELPILATQQPEYKKVVEQYEIGVCVNPDEPNAYFKGLQAIFNNYDLYKTNLIKAKQELNWDNEKQKLYALYTAVESTIKN